ncbi:helix-turn-helix domain-containing protein [Clostridium akagii]|uniref:helix-turn-helix domain-containing protein n=1 Tax=Clostridium akagii TaxID=91623 RepID=UPI00068AD51F|nr:helix-turn-helix transcriptional regulator [Clostridium akagii]
MKLHEKLKSIRIEKHKTTYELSALTGIPQSTISKMENGKRKIEAKELELLAKCLNVSITDFFDKTNKFSTTETTDKNTINPKIKSIIDSLDRAGDLQDEDIDDIGQQLEFLINLKRKKNKNS